MRKYLLVRTPQSLVRDNKIGIGWASTDFTKFDNPKELIQTLKSKYPKFGRRTKQLTEYFNLKLGDIVVVPTTKSIQIAEVIGEKLFDPNFENGHGANQITVRFFSDKNGIIKVPRAELKENFETRLKLQLTVGNLASFSNEIDNLINSFKNEKSIKVRDIYNEKVESAIDEFKANLLSALKKGDTRIKAGGRGLEELVKQLLEIEGYSNVKILGKSNGKGKVDVDIQAVSENNPFLKDILVQVKHHKGYTSEHALEQLIAVEKSLEAEMYKWVITTGSVSEEFLAYAATHNINVLDGAKFVDWLYVNLDKLSESTKAQLGIIQVPILGWV